MSHSRTWCCCFSFQGLFLLTGAFTWEYRTGTDWHYVEAHITIKLCQIRINVIDIQEHYMLSKASALTGLNIYWRLFKGSTAISSKLRGFGRGFVCVLSRKGNYHLFKLLWQVTSDQFCQSHIPDEDMIEKYTEKCILEMKKVFLSILYYFL